MAQSKYWIFPLKIVIFHSYVNVYQRVNICVAGHQRVAITR